MELEKKEIRLETLLSNNREFIETVVTENNELHDEIYRLKALEEKP